MTSLHQLDRGDPATAEAFAALQRVAYRVEADLIGTSALPALHETAGDVQATAGWLVGALEPDAPGLAAVPWAPAQCGRLAGAVSWVSDGEVVEVDRLVVHPAAFRRGIATLLLDEVDRREPGARGVVVATAAANLPARRLYERRGFTARGEEDAPGGVRIVRFERVAGAGGRPSRCS